jgi:predicted glycoside hydrolase/deacetylase ChbG (UPF0249 family)
MIQEMNQPFSLTASGIIYRTFTLDGHRHHKTYKLILALVRRLIFDVDQDKHLKLRQHEEMNGNKKLKTINTTKPKIKHRDKSI